MCVCVCKYTQPYFQSGAAWPPLRALPYSHRGACTVYRFSPRYSLKARHFSSLFFPLHILSISNNVSARWAGALQPPLQSQVVSLAPRDVAPGGAQGLWLCSWDLKRTPRGHCQDTKPDVEALGTSPRPRARRGAWCTLRPGGAASRPRVTLAPLLLEILDFPSV